MDLSLDLAVLISQTARARAQLNTELANLGSSVRIVDGAGDITDIGPTTIGALARVLHEGNPDQCGDRARIVTVRMQALSVENFDTGPWVSDPNLDRQ